MTLNNTLSTISSTTLQRLIQRRPVSLTRARSKISINHTFDKKVSTLHRKLINKGLSFFGDYLFSNKIKPYISFHFNTVYNIKDYGMIEIQEYIHRKPRFFEITIRKSLSEKSFLCTLAHELVHAQQYAYGKLSEYDFLWDGVDYTGKSYHEFPWEQEARMLEVILYKLYEEKYGNP